ncbi:MAG: BON domain-containing protein [Pseudomonadales bacterium]
MPAMFHRTLVLTTLTFALSACAIFSDDPRHRTPGVIIDDNVLEGVVEREIRKSDQGYKGSHIVVVAYNGLVLLAGQVPNEALRTKASEVTGKLNRVRKVHNELSIGGPISMVARTNDSWLTSKVKTRLVASKQVDGTKIKVQTEAGVVYLMGLIHRHQADAAVEVASQVYGIQKIVKVFEYLD